MKRDVIYTNGLVIAADNSGSIGEKPGDSVPASYETVGYFSARVALMECLAAGGEPFSAVIHNFAAENAWRKLTAGVKRAATEAGCVIEITGSTETNFAMSESAVGIVAIGRYEQRTKGEDPQFIRYGVVGKPLIGPEVLTEPASIAPLSMFREVLEMDGIRRICPIGSKGILYELRLLLRDQELQAANVCCALDIEKSAGPAACFVVEFYPEAEQTLKEVCGGLYRGIQIHS